MDSFLDNANDDELTGVCRFDLEKCFDTIDHEMLLFKPVYMNWQELNYHGFLIMMPFC